MKLKHFVIFWIIVVQLIGCIVGYIHNPSFGGVAAGWLSSVMALLAIIAASVVAIAAIWQDMD